MTQLVRLPQDTALLVLVDDGAVLSEPPLADLLAAWVAADMPRLIIAGPDASLGPEETGTAVVRRSEASAFIGTGLDTRLTAAGITTLVFGASAPAEVVTASIEDATDLGFRLILADDGAAGIATTRIAAFAKLAPAPAIIAGVGLLAARKRPWPTVPAKTF